MPRDTKLLAYQLVRDAIPELREKTRSVVESRTAASFQFIELALGELFASKLVQLQRLNETWAVPKFDIHPEPSPVKPLITHLGEALLLLFRTSR